MNEIRPENGMIVLVTPFPFTNKYLSSSFFSSFAEGWGWVSEHTSWCRCKFHEVSFSVGIASLKTCVISVVWGSLYLRCSFPHARLKVFPSKISTLSPATMQWKIYPASVYGKLFFLPLAIFLSILHKKYSFDCCCDYWDSMLCRLRNCVESFSFFVMAKSFWIGTFFSSSIKLLFLQKLSNKFMNFRCKSSKCFSYGFIHNNKM